MKNILIAVLFFFATSLFAQTEVILKFVTKDANGFEHYILVSDSGNASQGYGALPVKIIGGSVGGSSYSAHYDSLTALRLATLVTRFAVKYDSLASARLTTLITSLAAGDTLLTKAGTSADSTSIDSVSLAGLKWYEGDIYAKDTLKVSSTYAFTAGTYYYVYPTTLTPLLKWDTTAIPKLYFQSKHPANKFTYKIKGKK